MSPLFKKLNLKDQTDIVVLNAPESFESELQTLENVKVHRSVSAVKTIDFSLAFVTKQKQVDTLAKSIGNKAKGDAVVWFAYPKTTSPRYKCEFNRDTGWGELGKQGFEPVRQVAIDVDWSALRFRRAEFIKSMTRSFAMSKEGKKRTAGK
ncbi:MAG: hypothetical protein HDKAJFGB_03647 [Anaerolineae bacterium]|nr:hypothetical protein [Anaerolineae bacterium]